VVAWHFGFGVQHIVLDGSHNYCRIGERDGLTPSIRRRVQAYERRLGPDAAKACFERWLARAASTVLLAGLAGAAVGSDWRDPVESRFWALVTGSPQQAARRFVRPYFPWMSDRSLWDAPDGPGHAGISNDWLRAYEIVARRCKRPAAQAVYLGRAFVRAANLLRVLRYSHAHCVLAAALLTRPMLDGPEVAAIIAQALQEAAAW
jgi:hypothetical protein